MSHQEEAYLCLLCLRDSTRRIARLYWTYINLRTLSGDVPPVLIVMLNVLCNKQDGLHQKLLNSYPDDMEQGKWHDQSVQNKKLSEMTLETQQELQKICTTELTMIMLVGKMMEQ
ncbi:hypothetical protein GZ77_17785 [Endozoicomonas montiporae]|uniref:Uncharacterized protein n=2 Tax=Endozoicomonas montiporae TaxID=1027273 RepID=A0A081N1R6_9GAMM|nr:hypothetical protein [Endozoicomonas montiporae]AMO58669.1 hypothetical protein EZMO1_4768 [Endozoicomonas montiporae CL-33]KEQ12389.1 hypothetical protein GZ77_17785 [Endozoicomonas montiporae]